MQPMHVLLAVSAAIIAGLIVWLAYVIITEERSPYTDDER